VSLSYWDHSAFTQYDVIILGAGLVGLNTAASLKERRPSLRVAVLERSPFPAGASTRNAGFACFGSLTELLADLDANGPEAMLALVQRRWEGLQRLRQRLGDRALGLDPQGGYELLLPHNLRALERLPELNALLRPLFRADVFQPVPEHVARFGFSAQHVKGLVLNRYEATLDTGSTVHSLLRLVRERGVDVITGYPVDALQPVGLGLETHSNAHPEWRFRAPKVAICLNAFAAPFLPGEDIRPGRGLVLITAPLEKVPFRGAFHFEEGFYYFRDVGNRVLFGGGRNLDIAGETTTEFGENPAIRADLEHKLAQMLLPHTPHRIERAWSGIMAFGPTKAPIVKQVDAHTYCAVRCGGMGVALSSQMGDDLATLLLAAG
jgi:glycine/D-amino acid oxidase-like deaminating enzyme